MTDSELFSVERQNELDELVEKFSKTPRKERVALLSTLPEMKCHEWLYISGRCKDKRVRTGYSYGYPFATWVHTGFQNTAYTLQVHAWKQVMATANSLIDWVSIAEWGNSVDRKIAYKAIARYEITKDEERHLLRTSGSVWVQNIGEYLLFREETET